jgi:hypothetical protein
MHFLGSYYIKNVPFHYSQISKDKNTILYAVDTRRVFLHVKVPDCEAHHRSSPLDAEINVSVTAVSVTTVSVTAIPLVFFTTDYGIFKSRT